MPLTFNQLVADQATTTLAGEGGELHITYRPRMMTPRALKAMALLEEMDAGDATPQAQIMAALDSLSDQLAAMLVDWDMEYPDPETGQPNGVKVPPTRAGLEDVDYGVQMAVLQAIQAHMRPSKPNGRKSPKR